jgi:hypothetical protein
VYRIRAWHAPVTTKKWDDVSFHGRAFFVPATIASLGVTTKAKPKTFSNNYALRGLPILTDTPGENITCASPVGAGKPAAVTK